MVDPEPDARQGGPNTPRNASWADRLRRHELHVEEAGRLVVEGALKRMVGLTLEAVGCEAAVGSYCEVTRADGGRVEAEVVGFSGDRIFLRTSVLTVVSVIGEACRYAASELAQMLARGKDRGGRLKGSRSAS